MWKGSRLWSVYQLKSSSYLEQHLSEGIHAPLQRTFLNEHPSPSMRKGKSTLKQLFRQCTATINITHAGRVFVSRDATKNGNPIRYITGLTLISLPERILYHLLRLVHIWTQDLASRSGAKLHKDVNMKTHAQCSATQRDFLLRRNRKYFYSCGATQCMSCVGPIRFE